MGLFDKFQKKDGQKDNGSPTDSMRLDFEE